MKKTIIAKYLPESSGVYDLCQWARNGEKEKIAHFLNKVAGYVEWDEKQKEERK